MRLSRPLVWAWRSLPCVLLGALLVGSPTVVEAQQTHTCTRTSQTVTGALATDCNTLLNLKDTLRGTASLNWAAATDMDTWDGITIEGTPARVTKLKIQWGSPTTLRGTLPQALGDLTGLTELALNENRLTGAIPTQLGNLTALTKLNLSDNRLSGNIPKELGSLTSLTVLNLSGNDHYDYTARKRIALTGPIPSVLDLKFRSL